MKLLMATNNKGKVRELQALLNDKNIEVLTLSEAGYSIAVEEDGKTFAENALKKALETYKITKMPTIADDSGLCVDALSGAPGIYSARWAGEGATGEMMISKLLEELGEKKERGAEFVCSIALVFSEDDIVTAEGICRGEILFSPRGEDGFGYDPVFYASEKGKTFAEMSTEEKNTLSHRARAIKNLKEKLKKRSAF